MFFGCSLADIIELFEAFKEQGVHRNLTIIHLILTAWSVSLMQFTLVVTSTKTRKPRPAKSTNPKEAEKCISCHLFWETELWVNHFSLFLVRRILSFLQALSTTILLQDGPFLILRLGLIIHYKIISQSNVFFTTKNFLVVLLQLYRVCVIIIEHRKRQKLALLNEKSQSLSSLPRKSNLNRKDGTKSTNSLAVQTPSMTSLRPNSIAGEFDSTGNSDPLPRRKRSSATFPVPPPLPPPRPMIEHSKSLTTVSLNSQKICTEV